ncbi:Response regulator receiver protein [Desulfamplus magnetovallimortis]|uniref:Response regulator receiver protein n=1 Tax=Desulfamplus magnetovallimortis TaxID=1246637 RepID=A0A1W1HEE9_9BACT|nr:response regulator [Desulfamplus magnetovallimortis]SLM30840.1 Response regulator receiver protein [Desulfamplus magnetovallimortis]
MFKILVVDDSWLTRRGVKRILSTEGYEVCEAENGLQGLEILEESKSKIDAVILDLLMPEMNGVTFLETMKQKQMKLPVVVLTADIQNTVKQKCIDIGASFFLNKPPEPAELLEALGKLLNPVSNG